MGRKTEKEEAVEVEYWMRPNGKHTMKINGVKKRFKAGEPVPFPAGATPSGKDWKRVGEAPAAPVQEDVPNTSGLVLEPKGGGWYNVLNGDTGEPINDVGLKLDAAEALIAEMSGDDEDE